MRKQICWVSLWWTLLQLKTQRRHHPSSVAIIHHHTLARAVKTVAKLIVQIFKLMSALTHLCQYQPHLTVSMLTLASTKGIIFQWPFQRVTRSLRKRVIFFCKTTSLWATLTSRDSRLKSSNQWLKMDQQPILSYQPHSHPIQSSSCKSQWALSSNSKTEWAKGSLERILLGCSLTF